MQNDPYATVLVAVLKDRRDLDLAQRERWYRIPVRRLPARAPTARIIAFYQPGGTFGGEGGVVRYAAPIERWEMVRRRDLLPQEPEHPRADELYYRVWLGPVEPLPRPIQAGRWKRVAFLVTHWERLLQAAELRDLLHGTIWQERLWGALRRAGLLR